MRSSLTLVAEDGKSLARAILGQVLEWLAQGRGGSSRGVCGDCGDAAAEGSVPDRDLILVDDLRALGKRSRLSGRNPVGTPRGGCGVEDVVKGDSGSGTEVGKLDSMASEQLEPLQRPAGRLLAAASGRRSFMARNETSGWTSRKRRSERASSVT